MILCLNIPIGGIKISGSSPETTDKGEQGGRWSEVLEDVMAKLDFRKNLCVVTYRGNRLQSVMDEQSTSSNIRCLGVGVAGVLEGKTKTPCQWICFQGSTSASIVVGIVQGR